MKYNDIVTIGNGTGQGVVLQALRKITDLDRITTLVGVTDNGGHSGALRRELHVPSMGDVKTVIAALTGETVWGQLVRHRFETGRLTGISMGNLLITALLDESGSLYYATCRLTQALGLNIHIIPISDDDCQIVAELADQTEIEGEWEAINRENRDIPIVGVHHNPEMETNANALMALESANLILLCPGTLWLGIGSILATTGVREAIQKSKAIIIGIQNVLTQPGVTDGMTANDHLIVLEKMLGREINYYLVHDAGLPHEAMDLYAQKGFVPVVDDLGDSKRIVRGDIVSRTFINGVDRVHYDQERGYPHVIRHDPEMLAMLFIDIAQSMPDLSSFRSRVKQERWVVRDF